MHALEAAQNTSMCVSDQGQGSTGVTACLTALCISILVASQQALQCLETILNLVLDFAISSSVGIGDMTQELLCITLCITTPLEG